MASRKLPFPGRPRPKRIASRIGESVAAGAATKEPSANRPAVGAHAAPDETPGDAAATRSGWSATGLRRADSPQSAAPAEGSAARAVSAPIADPAQIAKNAGAAAGGEAAGAKAAKAPTAGGVTAAAAPSVPDRVAATAKPGPEAAVAASAARTRAVPRRPSPVRGRPLRRPRPRIRASRRPSRVSDPSPRRPPPRIETMARQPSRACRWPLRRLPDRIEAVPPRPSRLRSRPRRPSRGVPSRPHRRRPVQRLRRDRSFQRRPARRHRRGPHPSRRQSACAASPGSARPPPRRARSSRPPMSEARLSRPPMSRARLSRPPTPRGRLSRPMPRARLSRTRLLRRCRHRTGRCRRPDPPHR